MKPPALFKQRTLWWPTWFGWLCLLAVFAAPALTWFFFGEDHLCLTERRPADVLVVEGWIDSAGIAAAAREFREGGYRYVVATGGYSAEEGDPDRWGSYAEVAARVLLRSGVPESKIVLAPAEFSESQRTFEAARAVRTALTARGLNAPIQLNVFTQGAHARRSRLVYARTLGKDFAVGVISWTPPELAGRPWWKSSERTKDLIVETIGWFYELLLRSGRPQAAH